MAVKLVSAEYLRLKAEVLRKASLANKRLIRLENDNLTSSPAYQKWISYKGGVRFSVDGKDYNQLQQELARVNSFIESKTSTVRGLNKVLKDMAKNTGIEYSSVEEIQSKSKNFFKLADKIEQYLRETEGYVSAIGYKPVWQAINEYVKQERIDLSDSKLNIDDLVLKISKLISYEKVEQSFDVYSLGGGFEYF